MKQKTLVLLLVIALIVCIMPYYAGAEVAPPTVLSAPEHFGVSHNGSSAVSMTFKAPEDLRIYIEKRAADDPENKQNFSTYFQIDYKIDGGSWHHTTEWDSPGTAPDGTKKLCFTFSSGKNYTGSERHSMTSLFPQDEALKAFNDTGWGYLEDHSITFRSRFAHSFDKGKTYVLSPWSNEYILSANERLDYNQLINHAPSIISADLKATLSGEPYLHVKIAALPGEVADLYSASGGSVRTEVWMRRAEDKDFKYIKYEWAGSELLTIEASDYFFGASLEQSYEAEGYEIKIRYALDLRKYKQSGYSGSAVDIYSPFSNVISHNMPAWSNASQWATAELKKADDEGLIPDILKGADLTKPITRKEFAAVSVKLYEKMSGTTAIPVKVNPFKDTRDQEVLKAYHVGITAGVAADEFAPDDILNREQAATMLTRVFKKTFIQDWSLKADGSYTFNYTAPPKFNDDDKISDWAKPSVYFMFTHGVISGVGGNNFAPKATTSAEQAANYASATREQALAISLRMTEKLDSTYSKEIVPANTQPTEANEPSRSQEEQTKPTEPTVPEEQADPAEPKEPSQGQEEPTELKNPSKSQEEPIGQSQKSSPCIVGIWQNGGMIGHSYDVTIGGFRYNSGIGQRYEFNEDGTFTSSIVSSYGNMVFITGTYTVKDDVITFSNQSGKVSNNNGETWEEGNAPPDTSYYYVFDMDESAPYLIIGLEDAVPPLDTETNAVRYSLMDE